MVKASPLRDIFSPWGVVGQLIWWGLAAIASSVFRTLLNMTWPVAAVAGGGVGLLGVAAFLGTVILPRRDRIREQVRNELRALAQRGDRVVYEGGEAARRWKKRVHDYLVDALGVDVAKMVTDPPLPSVQLHNLRLVTNELRSLKIRSDFKPG